MNPVGPLETRRATRLARLPGLLAERILVLDGAMGTMIQAHRLDEAGYRGSRFADWAGDLKGNNDLLTLTQPDIIRDIHAAYLDAGADLPRFTLGTVLTGWSLQPVAFILTVWVAGLYIWGVVTLHRRGDRWPVGRTIAFVPVGMGLFYFATASGLGTYDETLISVQSNNWVVAHNTGANTKEDGIQVWQAYEVWGRNNTLYANTFTSGIPGYGVRVAYVNIGNVVGCDTYVPSSSDGISNKTCQK